MTRADEYFAVQVDRDCVRIIERRAEEKLLFGRDGDLRRTRRYAIYLRGAAAIDFLQSICRTRKVQSAIGAKMHGDDRGNAPLILVKP